MKGYGVHIQRVEAGLYEAWDEDGNYAGGIYKHDDGWHAQADAGTDAFPPYKAEVFSTLARAQRFVVDNVGKT